MSCKDDNPDQRCKNRKFCGDYCWYHAPFPNFGRILKTHVDERQREGKQFCQETFHKECYPEKRELPPGDFNAFVKTTLLSPPAPASNAIAPEGPAEAVDPAITNAPQTSRASASAEWTVVKELGAGRHGKILAIMCPGHDNRARKVFHGDTTREANVLQRLQGHPNIVQLFDTCETHVDMELAQCDLYKALYVHDLPIPDCTFYELASALEHVHSHQLAHRDIKPNNVLLVMGHAKLCDFGSVCSMKDGKLQGSPSHGSPRWGAPEVYQGIDQTSMRDIWSLGCTYMDMLCRISPWFLPETLEHGQPLQGGSFAKWVRQQCLNGKCPYPEMFLAKAPEVVQRCMIVEAAKRPDLGELKALFEKGPVQKIADTSAERNALVGEWQAQNVSTDSKSYVASMVARTAKAFEDDNAIMDLMLRK